MLVVTLGDPFSVNVELVSALLGGGVIGGDDSCVVVGSFWQWSDQLRRLGLESGDWRRVSGLAEVRAPGRWFVDLDNDPQIAVTNRPAETLSTGERGLVVVRTLETLRGFQPQGRLAVVTAPIDKAAAHDAGFAWPGHTEFFEEIWKSPAVMLLAGGRLRVGLCTNHVRLADLPRTVTPRLVADKLALLAKSLKHLWGIDCSRLAVCGLNPHCGDGGLFGDEETRLIGPGIELFRKEHAAGGAKVVGPLPADTVFHRALMGEFDAVLAMYHDQGLGPLKTAHFLDAVNVSGGLPHLRVSPDHGPASNLFLKKTASGESFRCALQLARDYLSRRGA